MRLIFLLALIAGIALGIGYPWAVSNFSGEEIGKWRAYERGGQFETVTVNLGPEDAPVRVLVDMTSIGRFYTSGSQTLLTVTATTSGRTVLAEALSFVHHSPREDSPQASDAIYRDSPGVIESQERADYVFTLGPGDADDIEIRSVELILRRNAIEFDARAQPAGFTLMGLGFIGLVASVMRRRRARKNEGSGPRWGRG